MERKNNKGRNNINKKDHQTGTTATDKHTNTTEGKVSGRSQNKNQNP